MSYHPTGDAAHPDPMVIRSGTPDRFAEVEVLDDQTATMRDGVRLGADVYVPASAGPLPAVVIRLPYGRRTPYMGMRETGSFFARKGYACVVQDVRGKFSSEGVFEPGLHEVDDGYDTVEWVVAQPFCDGRVGLWGESYYGATSYAAAISGHPAIRAIAPGDIGLDRRRSWFRQGALQQNTTGYWAMAMDAPEYADVSRIDPYHLPLAEMAEAAGLAGGFYRRLLAAVEDDAWWRARGLGHRAADVRVPMLSWGGWYDNYLGQQLDDRDRILATHPAPETVHLLVGPWDHEGSSGHAERAACLPVPSTVEHRWDAYQAFFDRYLRGEDNGFGAGGPVEVFTLGANRWQALPSFPPPEAASTPLYLRAGGRLSFDPPGPEDAEPDRYRYDPADPVDETVGANCWAMAETLVDRRRLDGRADIVRYVSEPLARPLALTGRLVAELHARTSAADTDFTVAVCHVLADGTVNTIQDGIVRARYRHGMDRPEPIEPGAVVAYRLDLHGTSYVVPAGDRLRVDVSSSCFDRYDRNPNTGEPLGEARTTVVADQAIFHDPARPSRVVLPVVPA